MVTVISLFPSYTLEHTHIHTHARLCSYQHQFPNPSLLSLTQLDFRTNHSSEPTLAPHAMSPAPHDYVLLRKPSKPLSA